jgi:uncharacterized protein (DUF1330 family)
VSSIRPNHDQFVQLMQAPDEGPVVMLNLLKCKEKADGGGSTGGQEYRKYGDAAVEMIEARGGKVIWSGRAEQILIGDPNDDWDVVLLVQYPSRATFVEMVSTPEYEQAHEHRESGLERTVVVACTPRADLLADGAR